MKKRLFVLIVSAILAGLLAACGSQEKAKEQGTTEMAKDTTQKVTSAPAPEAPGGVDEVAILDTNYGTMVLEFFPDVAPVHVANFKKLARSGFYDGTKFHRIVKGFMIQGGDPNTKGPNTETYGLGGPGYTINAEFNSRPHLKGTLSMARTSDPNSAGSQFFICLAPVSQLNGQYTVFGQLIKGTEVLDAIGNVKVKPNASGENSLPASPVILKKVTIAPKAEFTKFEKTGPEEGKK